jgi:hypothetical protein
LKKIHGLKNMRPLNEYQMVRDIFYLVPESVI